MSEDNDEKFPCVSKKFPAFRENAGAFAKEPPCFSRRAEGVIACLE